MIQKVNLCKEAFCCNETVIKFGKNLGFTAIPYDEDNKRFSIKNIKGDFEITKITQRDFDFREEEVKYENNAFYYNEECSDCFNFYITANIEMDEMNDEMSTSNNYCSVNYHLFIPSTRLQSLMLYEYYESEFVLPGYDQLKFTYRVRKCRRNKYDGTDVEVYIRNPYDVLIEGKQTNGGFEMNVPSIKDVDFDLLFRFDPNVYEPTLVIEPESSQIQSLDESKSPESVIPSYLSKLNENSKLYKIASNHKYADVIFITSDDTKIPSHRCILVNYSNIFGQIFEETAETPVEINVNDSTADTIQYALDFVNGKPDSIIGKEMEVFKFAVNYGIKDLIETCCSFFEESVVPENVCEYIVIAYDNNFEELKQKCLKMLVEKKKEIDALKIVKLPKNIFIDAFFL